MTFKELIAATGLPYGRFYRAYRRGDLNGTTIKGVIHIDEDDALMRFIEKQESKAATVPNPGATYCVEAEPCRVEERPDRSYTRSSPLRRVFSWVGAFLLKPLQQLFTS